MYSPLTHSILKTVAYFDLFAHPLSADEIQLFLDRKADAVSIQPCLNELVHHGHLFVHGNYYSLRNEPSLLEKRRQGDRRAVRLLPVACRMASLLARFPFVRAVAISGSLSKQTAAENADIDYFIVTKSNKLWIARTLLHALKKLSYITRQQHLFCMNYFIDEQALEIEEKNCFTATELITLMPVSANDTITALYRGNEWAMRQFPNHPTNAYLFGKKERVHRSKQFVEWLLNNKVGDWIDNYFLRVTTRRWVIKEERHRLNLQGRRMAIRTGKHFAKPNPAFFQQRLLNSYYARLLQLEAHSSLESSHLTAVHTGRAAAGS